MAGRGTTARTARHVSCDREGSLTYCTYSWLFNAQWKWTIHTYTHVYYKQTIIADTLVITTETDQNRFLYVIYHFIPHTLVFVSIHYRTVIDLPLYIIFTTVYLYTSHSRINITFIVVIMSDPNINLRFINLVIFNNFLPLYV